MPTSHLECLPTELLIAITDHLPCGHSVLQLRHVSRTLFDILSSHDVVSHALVAHYPHSAEAQYAPQDRTKAVFDAVVRRSYTQPRRRRPRGTSELHCFPLFCSEEDQVLAYQTVVQKALSGWHCTLWDIQEDREVKVEIWSMVGGCCNEQGLLFGSAVLRDVWCEVGRGVMVVGGRHKHVMVSNLGDMEQGPYSDQKVELGYYGIHIAPRLCKHEHTFFEIYSLRRPTLGQLLSSFSFYGATSLTHTAANTNIFTSLSAGSLFIYALQPPQPPNRPFNLPQLLKSKPPALWRDFAYTSTTTALTIDTLGKYLFVYNDPGVGGFYDRGNGSVLVVSTADGTTLKKVTLADSRPLFEYRLERDDSRLWDWRFERACKPVHRDFSSGEEVTITWTGSYGVFGTRGARVGLEGLDSKHRFTGERTPVMIEWRIDTIPTTTADIHGAREKVQPTLYFAPSEHHDPSGGGGGVMALPTLLDPFEDVLACHSLVRWPVAVCSYRLGKCQGMLKWGGGGGGYYTSAGRERERDEGRAVSLWFERGAGAPWVVDLDEVMMFPRWKEVLEVSESVDNAWVFEGCGWLLYKVVKKRDWKVEEEKIRCKVEVVDYDSDVEMKDAEDLQEPDVQEPDVQEPDVEGAVVVRGVEGVGDKLVLMRF